MNILIVEDNEIIASGIEHMIVGSEAIKSLNREIVIFKARSYEEAIEHSKNKNMDIFLIDINLNGIDTGYTLALELREYAKYKLTWIVFVTGLSGLEREAYRNIHCYGYLMKPFTEEQLIKTIKPLIERTKKDEDKIIIKNYDLKRIIPIKDIIFIEANGRGSTVCTNTDTIEATYQSLKEFVAKLIDNDDTCFMQCHKSFIVNINYVIEFNYNEVSKLRNTDRTIPIGQKYRDKFLKFFKE